MKMPSLNSASTNNVYQSTFMPIFSNAEAMIKRLVIFAFFTGMSKTWLVFQIGLIIKKVKKDIPKDLFNRDAYINGLIASSNLLVYQYEKTKSKEQVIRNKMIRGGMDISKKLTPQNLTEEFKKNRIWAEAKGYVNVKDYEKELNRFISNVSQCPFTTKEKGKRPISLWQKAELDVRYEKQMEMLETLKSEGVELCWISSHPDCSKRCEHWQGKLVSLTKHATMSGFRVEKVNGNWVYSLPDIMAQVDKYGYHNNIICGFNCRHKLHKYVEGSVAPKSYDKEEIKRQREIETKIRAMERYIRSLKMKLNDYNIVNDKQKVLRLKSEIQRATINYKNYCEKNGYAWYQYRIDVKDVNIYTRKR